VNDAAMDVLRALGLVDLDFFLTSADLGEDVAFGFLFRRPSAAAASGAERGCGCWSCCGLNCRLSAEFGWFLRT
jgi:hypothetical protein